MPLSVRVVGVETLDSIPISSFIGRIECVGILR